MKPYYEHAGITIYHGNCREVLQCINTSKVDLVMADPPYGIGYKPRGSQSLNGFIVKRNFGSKDRLQGDSGKLDFDPSVITSKFKKVNQCWWGANNYADSLPRSKGWLVWYKADGMEGTKYGHAEIAWTNINMPIRGINFLWMGCARGGSNREKNVHPTQKPLQVITWALSFFKFDFVIDPYMGSGTTLRAAKDLNKKAIGIEIEEKYCEAAALRMQQEVLLF